MRKMVSAGAAVSAIAVAALVFFVSCKAGDVSEGVDMSSTQAVTIAEANAVTNAETDAETDAEIDAVTNAVTDAVTDAEIDAVTTGADAETLDAETNVIRSVHGYTQISQDVAMEMMERDDGHIILDVRRPDEFAYSHIPGAICIPNETIETEQPEELPDLDQVILIYCRSGNRSKQAAEKFVAMGYTNIYEFGGIIDWTGEIVRG